MTLEIQRTREFQTFVAKFKLPSLCASASSAVQICRIHWSIALAVAILVCSSTPLTAQLRPLEPFDQRIFDDGNTFIADAGFGLYSDQRASLAGTIGSLTEIGQFHTAWRSGRIAVELAGTVYRTFEDESVFASPTGGAREPTGERRGDVGDFRVGAVVLLTPPERPYRAALRFGTRLPTTDNEIGLERDRTDFFALLAGGLRKRGFRATAEAGLGINGTHNLKFEQMDVLVYNAAVEYRQWPVTPIAMIIGRMDGVDWDFRGNENLGEIRLGARVGDRLWFQAFYVRGFTDFSPSGGLMISAGLTR